MGEESGEPGTLDGDVGAPLILSSFGFIIGRWTAVGMMDLILARAGVELDAAAATVLLTLQRGGGTARPSALAQETGTSASNISKVLARLQAAGMIERHTEAGDLRAVAVAMTSAGRQAVRDIDATSIAMLNEMLRDWPEAELKQFSVLLGRFARSLRDTFTP
ncbi:DNA-binding MarR family transcriptional regulator [Thermocatellispora tengchongensis]|uniref:DNA-binding MarR family transcriptional regulator n=1 Tax=Thermocatellispora tengchongensis TaxID=1073253 RepID=A0A840PRQ8_9ACTN|nr:MarR family winged helix-turn-helix transcriptional regulator [Thermocatellispora tengchongensis]MBB5139797.1 DNA-binding MarR family transcriptional regulator [Thermocatellispora tengchongensis]